MMLDYFLQSIIIGISVAAVVGPISILFVSMTLEKGIKYSVAIGLGASLADGVYAFIAALGIASVSLYVHEHSNIIKFFGGVLLFYIGYKQLRKNLSKNKIVVNHTNYFILFLQIFFLTLASPITIASFIAIFTAIGGGELTFLDSIVMMFGCFLGSIIWWIILGYCLIKMRHKISSKTLNYIKNIASIVICAFGIIGILNSVL